MVGLVLVPGDEHGVEPSVTDLDGFQRGQVRRRQILLIGNEDRPRPVRASAVLETWRTVTPLLEEAFTRDAGRLSGER